MLEQVEKVFNLPARFIEVIVQSSRLTNITTKDGVAKDITVGEIGGFGVRVLDKTWGFASSNDLKDLKDAAWRALKVAKAGSKEVTFDKGKGLVDRVSTKPIIPPEDVSLEDKVDVGGRAYNAIKEKPYVVSSTFSYVDANTNALYSNSEGARIEWDSTRVAFFASVFAKKDSVLQFGLDRRGATAGFEFFKEPERIANQAADKALRLLEAREPPSGTFTVVLDPLLTGVFIHEALGHAVEADHVIQGDSILEGRIGQAMASPLVTIYDDPTIQGSFGFYRYDSEGSKASRTTLIKDGILKGFLHSRETASVLGMENTGNARSQSFDYPPIVRMSNTLLEPKDMGFEELLEGVNKGVYLLGSRGGEVDPAKGVFQFSAEEGFLVEKGMLTTQLRDVALSGETLKILREIDAVGREFDSHIGFCGKDGQSVPVGDGGVHVRTKAAVGGAG